MNWRECLPKEAFVYAVEKRIVIGIAVFALALCGYFYGYIRGMDDCRKQIIQDYKEGIKIERVK